LKSKLKSLEEESQKPGFWDDNQKASSVLKEKKILQDNLDNYLSLISSYENLSEVFDLLKSEPDTDLEKELENNIVAGLKKSANFKIQLKFTNPEDINNCFIEIHSGAGGTESCDWAQMLERMYLRFADKRGFKSEVLDELEGDAAGIKSATLKIDGTYAYGWLKNESGVHRLVRISPFDAAGKRHTSFASIWVYPEIDNDIDIEINPKDLRIDTYRASGAGGQHVNKTDSAVRITHIPTGTVVQCQNERSQHKNKEICMKMLKSKLYEMELRKKQEELDKANSSKNKIEWGSQIRSYVLHPYKKVKDLRSDTETSDADAVLDGDLEVFLNN
jgi:peptide chain release factor 2